MDSNDSNGSNNMDSGSETTTTAAAAAALNVISLANRAISWGGNTVMGLTNSRRDTPVSAVEESNSASAEDAEDKDQVLRKKIIQIHQDDSLSPGEKARRVQASSKKVFK